jgi:hypothetical protein
MNMIINIFSFKIGAEFMSSLSVFKKDSAVR